ncbi:MAG: PAS domain S-box protein [Phenylobacterium sp.]|uniref:PAS domain S-box protein n=1 Tax=Phenylobacterium sp. TaxID=1871053 RepID=UPI0011F5DAC4|nr:PAS domain S-box protein [Phenylobacterium sp.]TAJ73902.1 MAG: PAS domain S-box protein [Phenylobacterium sp.]
MSQASEEVLDAILRHAREAWVLADSEGHAIRLSASAEALIGHAPRPTLEAALADPGDKVTFAGVDSDLTAQVWPVGGSGLRLLRIDAPSRSSDAQLRDFIDHLPAPVVLQDSAARVVAANPQAKRLLGAAAAIGASLAADPRFADLEAERDAWAQDGAITTDETWAVGGASRRYQVARFRIGSDHASGPVLATILLDVTARRDAEQRLRESESRLAAFMNHAPVAMYLKEVGGRYVVVNRRMEEVVVSGVGEVLGRTTREVFNPIAAEFIEAADRRVVETGNAEVGEEHYAGADDFQYTFTTRFPVRNGDGRVTHIGGVLIDTTPLKRAERRTIETERRLSAFLTHAPFGMFLKDAQGTMLITNPEMARLAADGEAFVDGEDAAAVARREAEVIASGEPSVTEWFRPGRDAYGSTLAIRFPAPGDGGQPHLGGFVLDLSERKAAEADLARSQEALHQSEKIRALGSLLAGVSHELNNPLSAVLGNAIMLEEDLVDATHVVRAQRIRIAAERCARIVQVFLAMARQKPPHRGWTRLDEVVADALEITSYGLRVAGIAAKAELPEGLPEVWADADQLHQVIVNLIVNAQQALEDQPDPRTIRLRGGASAEDLWLEVEDSGPGVPGNVAPRIFEPFYTSKPQGVGTGLGLSVSLGIMEAHGGALELLPSNRGARFRLRLPRRAPADEVRLPPNAPESAMGSGRVLIVEDDPDVADALAGFLRRDGFEVEWTSGAESMTRLTEADHDLILCDLKMPAHDGPATLAWLSGVRPDLLDRIGFVTADVVGRAASDFFVQCGRPYAEKPFTRKSIRRLIAELRALGSERQNAPPAS